MATTQNYYKVKHGLEVPSQDTFQVTDNTGPTVRPSLNLDFAKTKTLDPRITFTRASTATYYDGKTNAKAEENLLPYSQSFASWSLAAVTAVANVTAPDGTTTGTTITATSTTTNAGAYQAILVPAGATFSIYAKKGNIKYLGLSYTSGGPGFGVFNLEDGTIAYSSACTASIVNAGNGWYRCILANTTGSSGYIIVQPEDTDCGGTNPWGGSSATTANGSYIYVWGAQVEQRDRATAYTPTTTAAITNYIPVLQTAASGTARFDHDPVTEESKGLLIEEQRTNLFRNSQNPGLWFQSNWKVISSSTVAPDGTNTASKCMYTFGATGYGGEAQTMSAGTYSFSVYAKAAEYRRISLWEGAVTAWNVTFDLSTGQVIATSGSATGYIQDVGNGWYRCTMISTHTAGTRYWLISPIGPSNTGPFSPGITGDDYSGVHLWGAQLEAGAFPTSYIPTTLTYTGRGSTGTFRDANNLIQTAAANVARYEPNASGGSNLLLEGAATNILQYTNNFHGIWNANGAGNLTVARNAVLAPDGSMTAALIRRQDIGGVYTNWGQFTQAVLVSTGYPNTNAFTGSMWLRSATGSNVSMQLTISDVSYVTRSLTVTVTPEWQRFSFTVASGTFNASATYIGFGFNFNSNNQSVYAWGAQLETGSTSTSLIPSVDASTGRSSVATYYDSTGILRTAASGQPRYSHNPSLLTAPPKLLLEAAATNLLSYSEQLNVWTANQVTLSADSILAPDGTSTADKVIENSSSGVEHFIERSVSTVTNQVYTQSIYVKAGETPSFTFQVVSVGASPTTSDAAFSVSGGVISVGGGASGIITSSAAIPVGNGWYRCSITYTLNGTVTSHRMRLYPRQSGLYTGNGSSGIYFWGAQLETGYAPSSYIQTVASAVTRAADTSSSASQTRAADSYSSAAVTRSGDAPSITSLYSTWLPQSDWTVYANFSILSTAAGAKMLFAGGNNTGEPAIYVQGQAYAMGFTNVWEQNGGTIPANTKTQVAIAKNGIAFTLKGELLSSPINYSSGGYIYPSSIGIGHRSGLNQLNGHINKFTVYSKPLSTAELTNITS